MTTASSIRNIAVLLIVTSLVVVSIAFDVTAQSCLNPIFIERSSPEANVIVLFDNSASMNEAVYSDDYDVNTNYSGDFTGSRTYYVSSDGSYTPEDFYYRWPNTPSANLVQSDQGQDGWYTGNYLNWIYYHATAAQIAAIPQATRIQVAKAVTTNLINATTGVRFGCYIFNDDNGGDRIADVGTAPATIVNAINAVEGDAYTPLGETMEDILDYFSDPAGPIQVKCEKNFVVIVTDGHPTKDKGVSSYLRDYDGDGNDPGDCNSLGAPYNNSFDCTDYLDDVAKYMFDNDLRSGSGMGGKQNVTTYVVGFNLDAPILQDTADNGGGLYFSANNAADLANSLNSVINDILTRKSAGTSVSVVSTEGATTNRIYRAKFKPGNWEGFLEAYDLPYNVNDTPAWRAENKLKNRDPDTRNIFTSVDGTQKIDFDLNTQNTIEPYLAANDSQHASDIIQFTRGNDVAGYRDRGGAKLGDIVDSSPVVVGNPAYFYRFNNYQAFRTANTGRDEVIYVGSNDGMIHCFRTANGVERWAYVPKSQLDRLKDLADPAYCHEYYCNLSPKVFDVYVNNAWVTMLIAGQREGGSGYTALDVTDPRQNKFSVMWDVQLPIVKESWSEPLIVRDKTLDKFVGVVTSGPDSVSNEAYLVVLDLADGSVISTDQMSTAGTMNMGNSGEKIDLDHDGYHDLMYVTDLSGNVWRYDLTQDPWDRTLLFQTSQPIQSTPSLTIDALGNVIVLFGTGRYMIPEDIDDLSQQTFYAIFDNHSGSTVQMSDLVDQTSTITALDANSRGWFFDLTESTGERVTRGSTVAAGTVYFTSFKPETKVCSAGGTSFLYTVDVFDGSNPDNDDESEDNDTDKRAENIGEGVLSEPVLDLVNEDIILQSTDTSLLVKDTKGKFQNILVKYWRETY